MSNDKLNLFQKLLEIQKHIMGLGKDKDTKNQYNPNGYKYVTGAKVLEHVKPLMNQHGIILKQEILSIDNERMDYATSKGNKSEILSKVHMKFTWIDCETGEKDENLFGANGQNDWEKGLGSALTYAERYFLLKYFHINTDEDDIDNPDRVTTPPVVQTEPKIDIDRLFQRLDACENLDGLKNVWAGFSPKEQKLTQIKKEAIKEKLTPKDVA